MKAFGQVGVLVTAAVVLVGMCACTLGSADKKVYVLERIKLHSDVSDTSPEKGAATVLTLEQDKFSIEAWSPTFGHTTVRGDVMRPTDDAQRLILIGNEAIYNGKPLDTYLRDLSEEERRYVQAKTNVDLDEPIEAFATITINQTEMQDGRIVFEYQEAVGVFIDVADFIAGVDWERYRLVSASEASSILKKSIHPIGGANEALAPLKQVNMAMLMYAADNNDGLPLLPNWGEATFQYLKSDAILQTYADRGWPLTYNSDIMERERRSERWPWIYFSLGQFENPSDAPLLFHSKGDSINSYTSFREAPSEGPFGGDYIIGFSDGSAKRTTQKKILSSPTYPW